MVLASDELLGCRLERLRMDLTRLDLDALVVSHPPNLFYLTNFEASAGILVLGRDGGVLIVDFRYLSSAEALLTLPFDPPHLEVTLVEGSYEETICTVAHRIGAKRIGVEARHLSLSRWQWLQKSLSGDLLPTTDLVEHARMVKDEHEVEVLRTAGLMLSGAVDQIVALIRVGRTEREIAAEVNATLHRVGFDRPAFETIVASGPNSAFPHAHPGERALQHGDLVVLDFGGVHDGYCVDLTRTVCVGRANPEVTRLHSAVLEAQTAALAAIRPGVPASSVDHVARLVLDNHGLADAFGHSTGHGLGIEVHELPRVGRQRPAAVGHDLDDPALAVGMVFTVEPGVYLPGVGGVRIEDDALVTEAGVEILTEASRALVVR